jgi:hypothetical protein
MTLTQARLKEVVSYDPASGEFRWLKPGRARRPVAGAKSQNYITIFIDSKSYRAHLLAWLYMKGEWPLHRVDHKDLNKHNNAFCNLRPATNSQNNANSRMPRHNTSGFKGVSPAKHGAGRGKPWQAQIGKDRKKYHLGLFATKEEAHAAYAAAANRLFGEFARTA